MLTGSGISNSRKSGERTFVASFFSSFVLFSPYSSIIILPASFAHYNSVSSCMYSLHFPVCMFKSRVWLLPIYIYFFFQLDPNAVCVAHIITSRYVRFAGKQTRQKILAPGFIIVDHPSLQSEIFSCDIKARRCHHHIRAQASRSSYFDRYTSCDMLGRPPSNQHTAVRLFDQD